MVSSFLRKTAEGFKGLPAEERAKSLARIRTRMQRELNALGDGVHEDEVVAKALLRSKREEEERHTGNGEKAAPPARPEPPRVREPEAEKTVILPRHDVEPEREHRRHEPIEDEPKTYRSDKRRERPGRDDDAPQRKSRRRSFVDNRTWLGVCAELAETARVPVAGLRAAFVAVGLLTGPLALWVYLGAYLANNPRERFREHGFPMLNAGLRTLAWIALLWGVGWGVTEIAQRVYETYLAAALEFDQFMWLPVYHTRILVVVVLTSLPLLLLSAIPMANEWNVTLRKIGQAVIALYAMAVFIGLICVLVSAGLQAVADYSA